jgi:hypothetical protein
MTSSSIQSIQKQTPPEYPEEKINKLENTEPQDKEEINHWEK